MSIVYIILGLILGIGLGCFASGLCYERARSEFGENASIVVGVIVCIISVSLICGGLCTGDIHREKEFIANFEAQKTVIEESIQNESLTGYERIQLVDSAAELNGELAERKVKISHWYNFHIDNDLYNDISPISLSIKEEK